MRERRIRAENASDTAAIRPFVLAVANTVSFFKYRQG